MEDQLYEIIAAEFSGEELSEEESNILQEWLEESPSHRLLCNLWKKMYAEGGEFRKVGGIDHSLAWQKIDQQRNNHTFSGKRRSDWGKRVLGIAAGIILLIGVGAGLFWKSLSHHSVYESVEVFRPGISCVQLQLDNGEKVELTSGVTSVVVSEEGMQACCDSNSLNYQVNLSLSKSGRPAYNTLVVPVGAEYRLVLSDGTQVYMNAASELRYPTVFSGETREVCLKGEAYFEVQPDTAHRFIVKTEHLDIEVLGTAFDVNAYPDVNVVSATLASGKIQAVCEGKVFQLKPGEQIRTDFSKGVIQIEEVNTEIYTCWKEGYYYFEACPLEEIMQILSRWYGITAVFQDEALKSIEFTGRLRRYEEVGQLFRKFEKTRHIYFTSRGNVVTVSGQ